MGPSEKRAALERRSSTSSSTQGLELLIIDDHSLFADGLVLLLERLGPGVRVASVPSCERALEVLAGGLRPDLVLFDLNLPGMHHLEAFESLQEHAPEAWIVAVSADERPHMIGDVMRAGARGYIPKSTNADVMLGALRLVLAGGVYVPEAVLNAAPAPPALTPRELEVLQLIASGHGNREIAERLKLAESTVRVHVTSLLRRLGVKTRFEAVNSPLVVEFLRTQGAPPARGLPDR